jgi:hypothetical protein
MSGCQSLKSSAALDADDVELLVVTSRRVE